MISGGGEARCGFGGGLPRAEIPALPLGACLSTQSLSFPSCKMGMTPRVITRTLILSPWEPFTILSHLMITLRKLMYRVGKSLPRSHSHAVSQWKI